LNEERDPKNRNQGTGRPSDGPMRASAASGRPKTIRSADMFAGGDEVIIEHKGAQYRLRQTSQGKLILTK
jgi:hemin uptake protein HemP